MRPRLRWSDSIDLRDKERLAVNFSLRCGGHWGSAVTVWDSNQRQGSVLTN